MKILRIAFAIVLAVLISQTFTANAQTLTFLHSFLGAPNDGDAPVAGVVQGTDGNFYGTTKFGGASGSGTVFRVTAGGDFTTLYSFTGAPDGAEPVAALVEGSDGNFYGTAELGGSGTICDGGCGTVFRISPTGVYTSLYSFTSYPQGSTPMGALVEGVDSNFYGTTYGGGTGFLGTVFRISPSGVLTTLCSFSGLGFNGAAPSAGLVLGSDGNFYGTTQLGGTNDGGTVFQVTTNGDKTTLYQFGGYLNSLYSPVASLVEGSDGNFYGTTLYGGLTNVDANGYGTIFRISPSGTYTSLYSFTSYPGGALPEAGLALGSDGNFYGTTITGGLGLGIAFRMSTNGDVMTLCTFVGTSTNGSEPYGTLIQATDGDLYGTTAGGGATNAGTVFRLAVSGGSGGGGCIYSLNLTNADFAAAGGSATVSITASNGCAWTALTEAPFISITSGSPGSGNGTVHYTVAANASPVIRQGTMNIAGQTFTVTQAGVEGCTYTLSPTSVNLTSKGGSKDVSVKTMGADCTWTAESNDPFIMITAGDSGTGNGKVAFTVLGNTNTSAVVGSITIAGETFTVNQLAGGCTFKLSPKSGKLKSEGGSGKVTVTPNLGDCDWTAVSNDSFITITAGANGTGKGTVTYSVTPNTVEQIGTITIAGQIFTVTVAGVK